MAGKRNRKNKSKRPQGEVGFRPTFFRPKISNNGASSVQTITTDLNVAGGAATGRNACKIIPIAPWSADIKDLFNTNFHYVKLDWVELMVMPWCKTTERAQFVSWIDDCSIKENIKSADAGLGLATWAQARWRTKSSTSEGTILRASPSTKWVTIEAIPPAIVNMENSFCEIGILGLSSDDAEDHNIAKICMRFSFSYKDRKVLDKVSRWSGQLYSQTHEPLESIHLFDSSFKTIKREEAEGSFVPGAPLGITSPEHVQHDHNAFSTTCFGDLLITDELVKHLSEHTTYQLEGKLQVGGVPVATPVSLKFEEIAVPSLSFDGRSITYSMALEFKKDAQITSVVSPSSLDITLGSRGPKEWDIAQCTFSPSMAKTFWRVNPTTGIKTKLLSNQASSAYVEPVDWLVYQDQILVCICICTLDDPRPGVDFLSEVKRAERLHRLRMPYVALGGYTV